MPFTTGYVLQEINLCSIVQLILIALIILTYITNFFKSEKLFLI